MDTVKPALPDFLQVSDVADKERPLTTSKFLSKQANDRNVEKLHVL